VFGGSFLPPVAPSTAIILRCRRWRTRLGIACHLMRFRNALTNYTPRFFSRCYGMECIGLRYFNVFGPRQDPNGAYAAVIPRWIAAMIEGKPVEINGDGETSRDFCYVANAVQANLLAATTENIEAINQVYNVAVGERTTLNQLFCELRDRLLPQFPHLTQFKPLYREFRAGDVRHSHADISRARALLGYEPTHRMEDGLDEALAWYVATSKAKGSKMEVGR